MGVGVGVSVTGFNPTLVRLRHAALGRGPLTTLSFNPTLVRLRPGIGRSPTLLPEAFQSHAGSIEAIIIARLETPSGRVSIPRWFD